MMQELGYSGYQIHICQNVCSKAIFKDNSVPYERIDGAASTISGHIKNA